MNRCVSVCSQLLQLFTHRDLWAWLNAPFTGPPAIEAPEQLVLTAVA